MGLEIITYRNTLREIKMRYLSFKKLETGHSKVKSKMSKLLGSLSFLLSNLNSWAKNLVQQSQENYAKGLKWEASHSTLFYFL